MLPLLQPPLNGDFTGTTRSGPITATPAGTIPFVSGPTPGQQAAFISTLNNVYITVPFSVPTNKGSVIIRALTPPDPATTWNTQVNYLIGLGPYNSPGHDHLSLRGYYSSTRGPYASLWASLPIRFGQNIDLTAGAWTTWYAEWDDAHMALGVDTSALLVREDRGMLVESFFSYLRIGMVTVSSWKSAVADLLIFERPLTLAERTALVTSSEPRSWTSLGGGQTIVHPSII